MYLSIKNTFQFDHIRILFWIYEIIRKINGHFIDIESKIVSDSIGEFDDYFMKSQ